MAGIFICYRRADTIAWAGRLFGDLVKRFGAEHVFMDINGGIPRGARFDDLLEEALAGCDVLLAMIGPVWAGCTRGDGGPRRLDLPDDWVRNEIATALQRNIVVVPVLFGRTTLPDEQLLPEPLRLLTRCQAAEISDSRWEYDVGELIKDLLRVPALRPFVNDVDTADAGMRTLRDLIVAVPAVGDAVSRSKEVIQNAHRQIARLDVFKAIHDALHTIEFDCLKPMQASGPGRRVRLFRIQFASQAGRIQEALRSDGLSALLRDDLLEQLTVTTDAFEAAVAAPGDAAHTRVVAQLTLLLSAWPSRLDAGIADAAAEINLQRLVELMTTVRGKLPPPSNGDGALAPLTNGIDALDRLCGELQRRVAEHTILQRLDVKLRTVCVAGAEPDAAADEWKRIKMFRSRLQPPFSPIVDAVNADLVAIEAEIERAVTDDASEALDLLAEYFRAVSSVFRDVDSDLREFCLRLNAVSQPLKMILDLC